MKKLIVVLGAVHASLRQQEHCPPLHQCPNICKGPKEVSRQEANTKMPECAPGIGMIWDDCECCRKCAQQRGEMCDMMNPCDHTRGLTCQVVNSKKNERECQPRPGGKTCFVQGREFANGEQFNPSNNCKLTCICVNGDIGCYPTCQTKPPSNCKNPRLCQPKKGECCGEWTCGRDKKCDKDYQQETSLPFASAYKAPDITAAFREETNCYVQTTAWSPCSRDCGWGIRERISNDNDKCEMHKETKLCQVRPCNYENELQSILESSKFKHKLCSRTVRAVPTKFSFSGCESKRTYRPRYCGKCKDKKCCTPDETETIEVDFVCKKGDAQFTKKMDSIKTCKCENQCYSQQLDIFSSVKLLTDDFHRGK